MTNVLDSGDGKRRIGISREKRDEFARQTFSLCTARCESTSCSFRRAKSTDILTYISPKSPILKALVPFHHLDAHLSSDSSDAGRLADTRRTGQEQYALEERQYISDHMQDTCRRETSLTRYFLTRSAACLLKFTPTSNPAGRPYSASSNHDLT